MAASGLVVSPGDVMQNLTFDGSTIMSAGWIGQVVLTVSRHVSPPRGEPGHVSPAACEPGHVAPPQAQHSDCHPARPLRPAGRRGTVDT